MKTSHGGAMTWRRMKTDPPGPGVARVLLVGRAGSYVVDGTWETHYFVVDGREWKSKDVEWWMPYPEPPSLFYQMTEDEQLFIEQKGRI